MKAILFFCVLCIALVGGCSKAGPPGITRSYPIQGTGAVAITFPEGWKDTLGEFREVETNQSSRFNSIQLTRTNLQNCIMMIIVIPLKETGQENLDLKALELQRGQNLLTNAVETAVDLRELKGAEVSGYYFQLTDKRWVTTPPPATETKYIMLGGVRLGPLLLGFFLYTNDKDIETEALQIVRTAHLTKP